jgi:hypothetical protein
MKYLNILVLLLVFQQAKAESIHLCCDFLTTCGKRIFIDIESRTITEMDDEGGKRTSQARISDNKITWEYQGGRNNMFTYHQTVDRFSLKYASRRNDGVSWVVIQCKIAPPLKRQF